MAERGACSRWSLGSKTTALLGVGAVGAVVVGLVWIAGGDGGAAGRNAGARRCLKGESAPIPDFPFPDSRA